MTTERVRVDHNGYLATVSMIAPERLNVLDRAAWEALPEVFATLGSDDDVRCIVLRGTGGRAFSAGSDIGGFAADRDAPADVARYSAALGGALHAIASCAHPVVALIEGLCVGGGLEMAAACDVRVCGEGSRFGAPINRLGLTMSYEELTPLVALLGPGLVLDLLLTGDLVDAERAREAGLVTRVFPDGALVDEAYALARRIADGAPLVNRWHKRFVRRLLDPTPLSDAERAEPLDAFATDDYREGRTAFLEKRRPEFRGE